MGDNFGQYADSVQGADVSFLKSGRSLSRWGVSQLQLEQTILQEGFDGGAGFAHGVTDPGLTSVLMQVTEFDDRVLLDGTPFPSRMLVVLPPGCHFNFVRTGPVSWFSWSMRKDDELATRLTGKATRSAGKTDKSIIVTTDETAGRLRKIVNGAFSAGRTAPLELVERELFNELESAWKERPDVINLPSEHTRLAERIVVSALRYAQLKYGENVLISELVENESVGYRTLLRAFERYIHFSPKHYLKLRQLNAVYHAIRKNNGFERLTDILGEQGVNEFGRFAGEYRAIFAELPSDTYRRHRPGL